MADQRDRRARLDLEVDVVQDRPLGVVAERDVLEAEPALARRERPGARPVADLLRLVEHLEDALAGGDGALARSDPHPEHPQWHDEVQQVDVEGDEGAERKVAVHDAVATFEQRGGLREQRQEREQGDVERLLAGRPDRLLEDRFAPGVELGLLAVLLRERLDDVDADDVLLGDRRHVRHPLLDVPQDRVRLP